MDYYALGTPKNQSSYLPQPASTKSSTANSRTSSVSSRRDSLYGYDKKQKKFPVSGVLESKNSSSGRSGRNQTTSFAKKTSV